MNFPKSKYFAMERPILSFFSMKSLGLGMFMKFNVAYSLITLTLIFSNDYAFGQTIDCNSILACNDGVQISMDENCEMVIMPDMILEAQAYNDEAYDVEATMPNGNKVASTTVGLDGMGRPIVRPLLTNVHVGMTLKVKVSLRGCGNACWGYASIEDKLPPVIVDCPCEERITWFRDTIFGAGPTYQRPVGSICDPGGAGSYTPADYVVFQFAVDETGIVDITLGQTNSLFNLYADGFDPLNPCDGLIVLSTRSHSGTFEVGRNYFIVVSSVSNLPSTTNILVNSLYIDSREGNVKSSVDATICQIACKNEAAFFAQTAVTAPNPPIFEDACGGPMTFIKIDSIISQGCGERHSKVIRRTWIATDRWGNTSEPKNQYYYVQRLNLADVVCPADWIRTCNTTFAKRPNGAPLPSVSGMPSDVDCQNIQVHFEDVVFPLCGQGIKVLRQWFIIDWCTGEERICNQTIKVEDEIRPIITCPADNTLSPGNPPAAATISVKPGTCIADWQVIPPIAISECSKFTWEVAFKKADSNGNPPAGANFVTIDGLTRVNGSTPAYTDKLDPNARPYTIVNLPLGRTWLRYTVTDECGNSTDCFTEIDVVDTTPPTAICEGSTVVTLGDNGWAELMAESLDDHSHDNCNGDLTFLVRRATTHCAGKASDLTFQPYITFCCEDVTTTESYVDVVLRVIDQYGNYNECTTKVKVQNKRPPTIICPTNKTLTCGDSRIANWVNGITFDTSFFGKPTVGGTCSNLVFNSRIKSNNINLTCGTGTVVKEWFLVSNPSVKCDQTLTVVSPTFTSVNVTFPGDITLPSCDITDATPDALNSKPVVSNAACRDIGITHSDEEFFDLPEACIKILRTWKVIDWCTYPSSQVVAEKVQVIKLTGSTAPEFTTPCLAASYTTDAGTCERILEQSVLANDECTEESKLKYTWAIDFNKNGTNDRTGTGKSFRETLPIGVHRVTFIVENRCGSKSSCSYDVTITSSKKPTPICIREVTWVLDADGTTEVWASDFDLKSEAACGQGPLRFSFNEAGTQPAKTFTCADIPNGQVAMIPLEMWVIDSKGNKDHCDVILVLQDSPLTNACPNNTGLLPVIGGNIHTEAMEGVENVEVNLIEMDQYTTTASMTDSDGAYTFIGSDVFSAKEINANNEADILNGVSTLDLVLIQRHILGLETLPTPYKLLAADINNSRSITASDLSNLRKVILGVNLGFDNNTSWRFVPESYVFDDPLFPFDFPSKINLDSIYQDKMDVDFIAVKIGDVNESAVVNAYNKGTESRSIPTLVQYESNRMDKDLQKVSFYTPNNIEQTLGFQVGISFDPTVYQFKGIEAGQCGISKENIHISETNNGLIKISYDNAYGQVFNDQLALFHIIFSGSNEAVELSIDNDEIANEWYDKYGQVSQMTLRHKSAHPSQNELYQNVPNPFNEQTVVGFDLNVAAPVRLSIYDITGKIVFDEVRNFETGYNEWQVFTSQIGAAGLYYYQIESNGFKASKKMIIIE